MSQLDLGIYEHVLAGGCGDSPPPGLVTEGAAMLRWAAQVAAKVCERVRVAVHPRFSAWLGPCRDAELVVGSDPTELLRELASRCRHVLVIAPEIDGTLSSLVRRLFEFGRLINLSPRWTDCFSDKVATSRWLAAQGVPVLPHRTEAPAGGNWVCKPRFGAGSEGVRFWRGEPLQPAECLSPWTPGLAASISVVLAPDAVHILPAAYQWLRVHEGFRYAGGAVPLPGTAEAAAQRVARQLAELLEGETGFVGLDLIFPWPALDQPLVVEINPRVTTSVIATTRAAHVNPFRWLLGRGACARNRPIVCHPCVQPVCFWPHGEVRSIPLGASDLEV